MVKMKDNFAYFSIKTNVVGAMLWVGFNVELTKSSFNYHKIPTLSILLESRIDGN